MRTPFAPPLDPSVYPFRHQIRVRFAETDAMGIVHHAAYLPYLEEARVEWLRVLGHPYGDLRAEGTDLAVVEVQARYRAPARFDDLVQVHLGLGPRARSTFRLGYLLTVDGQPVLTAVTVHAAVRPDGRPTRLPRWLVDLALPSLAEPGPAGPGGASEDAKAG
jgi:acyl-CoA thioester hydrolase